MLHVRVPRALEAQESLLAVVLAVLLRSNSSHALLQLTLVLIVSRSTLGLGQRLNHIGPGFIVIEFRQNTAAPREAVRFRIVLVELHPLYLLPDLGRSLQKVEASSLDPGPIVA